VGVKGKGLDQEEVIFNPPPPKENTIKLPRSIMEKELGETSLRESRENSIQLPSFNTSYMRDELGRT